MDQLLSRFPDIAEDIFENLNDESLVRCKEASRLFSSFMDEDTKFWKRIIRKYLHNEEETNSFKKSWESLIDLKQTGPEMLKELGQAVQNYLNRHEGQGSQGKCFEEMEETCRHRECSLSPLHVAAEAGNTLLYKFILDRSEEKNPIFVKWRFDFGLDEEWTPLLAAARYGHLDTCLAIMESLEVKNPRNSQGLTPLHAAATGGHLQVYSTILEKLGNQHPTVFNPEDEFKNTPLHFAARKGHVDVCEAILNVAWIKNPVDKTGDTALHNAAVAGHAEICKMIMLSIDDLNPCDAIGWTPFELAAAEGHLPVCEVMMSLMKDKNPKSKSKLVDWWTPLHSAALNGYLEVCNAIMNQVLDKNPINFKGVTPLHAAAERGHSSVCEAIMNNVINKNPPNNKGDTPLHCAAANGHIQLVKDILKHVTIKNPVNNNGQTPKALFLSLNAVSENDMNDMDWE